MKSEIIFDSLLSTTRLTAGACCSPTLLHLRLTRHPQWLIILNKFHILLKFLLISPRIPGIQCIQCRCCCAGRMQGLVPLGLISKFEVVAVCYHRIEPGIIVRDREEEERAVNKHSRTFTVLRKGNF